MAIHSPRSSWQDAGIVAIELGPLGSGAAWRQAERGIRIAGTEPFGPGQDRQRVPVPVPTTACAIAQSTDGERQIGRSDEEAQPSMAGGRRIGEPAAQTARHETPFMNTGFVDPSRLLWVRPGTIA